MLRVVALTMVLLLAACNKTPPAAPMAPQALLIAPEDLVRVQSGAMASGPPITGSIQPERRADLRAEVSAVVLQVVKDNGDRVRAGELLVRLDDTALRDSLASAEDMVRTLSLSLDQSQRQWQRLKTLRESGMASTQQLEDAETKRNNAESDLSAARTRSVQARQQLERTLSRAPFDGIVSERRVSAGDTAQIGKELLKVIDPSSMRFEGLVSADTIGQVKVGQGVHFRVNGYGPQEFAGSIRRINPSANPSTRQVEVLVAFSGDKRPQLAGLYAEGRIETGSRSGLMIPAMSVVREGDKAFAWKVSAGQLRKVAIELGERDPRSGQIALRAGLDGGDQLIRNPTSALSDGQPLQLQPAAPKSGASAGGN